MSNEQYWVIEDNNAAVPNYVARLYNGADGRAVLGE